MTDPFLSNSGSATVPDKGNRLRILVVDDDRTLRDGCASVLQMEGHVVTSTGRGEEAIELVKRRKFDMVLVDLYLTPISGMEILKAAVEAHKDVIVLVMTGNPSVASSIEALRAGAWDYLPKPFSASHLKLLIGRAGTRDVPSPPRRSGRRSEDQDRAAPWHTRAVHAGSARALVSGTHRFSL